MLRQWFRPNLNRLVLERFVQHAWIAGPGVIDSNCFTICDGRPYTVHVNLVAHIEALFAHARRRTTNARPVN